MKILAIIALASIVYLFWHFHKKPIDKWWKLFLASVAVFASGNFIFSFMPQSFWRLLFFTEAPKIAVFLFFLTGGITTSLVSFFLIKSLIIKDYDTENCGPYFGGFLLFFAILFSIFCYARAFLPLIIL